MTAQERIRKVEAIVISHADYGEADRFLVLFTREMGKVRALAKGVRKAHSRKAGHLEPFTCSTLMLARGASFWIVTQAESVNAFLPIRADLTRTGQAAYILELAERFSSDDEENPQLYRLVKEALERITNEADAFYAIHYYEMRFLELVGYKPELFQCVQCRKEIQAEEQFFSPLQGGVLCPACGTMINTAEPVSMPTLKYLRHFQRSSYAECKRAALSSAQRNEIEKFMQHYLVYLAERRLNSPRFLSQVRRLDGQKENEGQ